MKKISIILTVLVLVIFAFSISVLACSTSKNGQITGAACSIKELQQQENGIKQQKMMYPPQRKSYIMMNSSMQNSMPMNYNCFFGNCLYQKILNNSMYKN